MKRITTLILTGSLLSLLTACGQSTSLPNHTMPPSFSRQSQQQVHSSRQLMVRFQQAMTKAAEAEFSAKYGLHLVNYLPELDVYIVEIDASVGLQAAQVVSYLQKDPAVAHAEINHSIKL